MKPGRPAPDPVPTIDPLAIAPAIEANLNAYLLSFAGLPGATLHDGTDLGWVDSGFPTAIFNPVVRARFAPGTVDARIGSVLSHFRRVRRPFTWHVGPTAEPAGLAGYFLARGLVHSEDEPGMAVEIDRAREAAAPAGLTIETVRDERGIKDWVDVWLFPVPEEGRRLYLEVLRHRASGEDLPWRYYVGRLNGAPVATAELFTGEGVASVHDVVTLPEARRRGIGAAMTLRVLREARALGYRVGVLTASPHGVGVYRRMGFREYCRFRRFEWEPN